MLLPLGKSQNMTAEAEVLLELIAHKLKFVDDKPLVCTIQAIQPIGFLSDDKWQQKLAQLGALTAEVLNKDTDVLLVEINGYSIAQTLAQLPDLMAIPGWDETRALQLQRVYLVDDLEFKAASPLEQIEILAEIIHPKLFAFGHEGKAWIKFSV
jgi:iron complex transport system substrate-binding protein